MKYSELKKTDLLEMIDELENEVDSLQNGEFDECCDCDDLRMELKESEDRIEELEDEVQDLENKVNDLEDSQIDSETLGDISEVLSDAQYKIDNMIQ